MKSKHVERKPWYEDNGRIITTQAGILQRSEPLIIIGEAGTDVERCLGTLVNITDHSAGHKSSPEYSSELDCEKLVSSSWTEAADDEERYHHHEHGCEETLLENSCENPDE